MSRARLLALLLAVLGSIGLEAILAVRESRRRDTERQLRALLDADERDFLPRASSLEVQAGRTRLRLVASPDGWVCPDLMGVPANASRLEGLLRGLVEAEGRGVPAPPEGLGALGLGDAARARLEFRASWHDPVRLEIGRPLESVRGGFARRADQAEPLLLDADLGALLAPEGPLGLIDRRLGAPGWPPEGEVPVALEVRGADSTPFRLELRARLRPADPAAGPATPFEWVLATPGPAAAIPGRTAAYLGHLGALRWIAVLAPEAALPGKNLGTMRWTASGGDSREWALMRAEPGLVAIDDPAGGRRYLVEEADLQRLVPPVEALCSAEEPSPWDRDPSR